MTKIQLLEYLTRLAKDYRKDANESINRNKHMNNLKGNSQLDQDSIDAILTDFINIVALDQKVDYGLYTKDLLS